MMMRKTGKKCQAALLIQKNNIMTFIERERERGKENVREIIVLRALINVSEMREGA